MIPRLEESYTAAKSRLLLLDYDGTLSPIKPAPPLAKPTPALLGLLTMLTKDPKNRVVIISGRDHETLDKWLGQLPLDFAAEHGLLIKENDRPWHLSEALGNAWKAKVKPVLSEFSSDTPGSFIEEKVGGLAWHYRKSADAEQARKSALKLINRLQRIADTENLSLLDGSKVVEVKTADVDKGIVAHHWLKKNKWDFILAAGDDTTDEDLFKAMPEGAFTVKIGAGQSAANSQLESPKSLRALLKKLASS